MLNFQRLNLFEHHLEKNRIIGFIKGLIDYALLVLAGWMLTAIGFLHFHGTFRGLIHTYTIILVIATLGYLIYLRRQPRSSDPIHWPDLFFTILLVLAGALLSLLTNRPDADDVGYISQAVYFREHARSALSTRNYYQILDPGADFKIYYYFQTIYLLWGYLAYILKTSTLKIYHFLAPFLGGAFIVMAWIYFFSRFAEKTRTALIATLAVMAFLAIDGSMHRTFGNFAFVRIWQGKAMLISIAMPLFVAATIDYIRSKTPSYLLNLFLVLLGCLCLSSTSLFLIPALITALVCGYIGMNYDRIKNEGRYILSYIATFIPLLLLLAALYFTSETNIDYMNRFWAWSSVFNRQFKLVFHSFTHIQTLFIFSFLLITLLTLTKRSFLFLFCWVLSAILFFLNPIVFKYIAKYVTTYSTYWRLFYVLPVPFLMGMPIAWWLNNRPGRMSAYIIAIVLIMLPIAVNQLPPDRVSNLGVFNKKAVKFPSWGYKIPADVNEDRKRIMAAIPGGDILMPSKYNWILPMFSSDYRVLAGRRYVYTIGNKYLTSDGDFLLKNAALVEKFVSGEKTSPQYRQIFIRALDLPWAGVVLDRDSAGAAADILKKNGFSMKSRFDNYQIWARQSHRPARENQKESAKTNSL